MSRVDVIISLQEIILELGSHCTIQVNVKYDELNNVARLFLAVLFCLAALEFYRLLLLLPLLLMLLLPAAVLDVMDDGDGDDVKG